MDSENDCRVIAFDEMYRRTYGCYPEDEVYEDEDGNPLDEDEIREIKKTTTHEVRKRLGWDRI